MSEEQKSRELDRYRTILRLIDEKKAAKAAQWRSSVEQALNLMDRQFAGKRRTKRQSSGMGPGGVLTQLQIRTIQNHRESGLSYGMIARIMGISKASAHKYGRHPGAMLVAN